LAGIKPVNDSLALKGEIKPARPPHSRDSFRCLYFLYSVLNKLSILCLDYFITYPSMWFYQSKVFFS